MKKTILTILTILLCGVMVLGLTGCGITKEDKEPIKDDKNASIKDDKDAGIVTGKYKYPEEVAKCPMSKDGDKYIYEAFGEEFVISTNIWDFIDVDKMVVDFNGLIRSLGYNDNNAYDLGENEIDWSWIYSSGSDPAKIKANYRNKTYEIKYSHKAMPWTRFRLSVQDSNRVFSEEMIILGAYAAENMRDNPGSAPLGNHLKEYFYDFGDSGEYELP